MPKAKAKTKTPKRDRTGYVMVELRAVHRAQLEMIRQLRATEIDERTSLSATIRSLIRREFERLGLKLNASENNSD